MPSDGAWRLGASTARTRPSKIERLLSNGKLNPWRLFASWIRFAIGPRMELLIAMDWTEFRR